MGVHVGLSQHDGVRKIGWCIKKVGHYACYRATVLAGRVCWHTTSTVCYLLVLAKRWLVLSSIVNMECCWLVLTRSWNFIE